jgi:thermostable 8-oxoguanine DNA glycosylase
MQETEKKGIKRREEKKVAIRDSSSSNKGKEKTNKKSWIGECAFCCIVAQWSTVDSMSCLLLLDSRFSDSRGLLSFPLLYGHRFLTAFSFFFFSVTVPA